MGMISQVFEQSFSNGRSNILPPESEQEACLSCPSDLSSGAYQLHDLGQVTEF